MKARDFLQKLRTWYARAKVELVGTDGKPGLREEEAFLREFKPDAVAIEERPVPVSIHAAMYVLCALLVVAILWSFIGTMDRIVVGQGKVVTTTPVNVLQPFAVSRILAIKVKPGDRVNKGDVLMAFDPAFASADESSLEARANELNATVERLQAEIDEAPFVVGDSPSPERRTQGEIFARRSTQLSSELEERDSNLRKIQGQISANRAAISDLQKQLKLAKQVTAMRQKLKDLGSGSELQLVIAQKDELDVGQRLREAIAQKETLEHSLAQTQAERDAYLANWRRQLNEDLVTTRQQAKEANDALGKARRMREFTALVAPMDAIVLEIADRSVGSVLREAEMAVTLVPVDAELEVEGDVLSKDVGYVSIGDPVRVKLEAYPFQKFGTLEGTLSVVSPDSVVRQGGQGQPSTTVFHVRVHIKDTVAELARRGIRLRPGLIATAEISAGHRSIASYLLYPIWRMFDEGMKEP